MTRISTLTGRTFLLIFTSVGMLLAFGQAYGAIHATFAQTAVCALVLSVGLNRAVCRLQTASWRDLMQAVRESERTGRFRAIPTNSPLPEVNRLADALNGATHSILKSQEALEAAYLEFVETMAQALDARDPYTAGHSLRVAAYSYALAIEMGLPEEESDAIRVAAQLHDIGKIGIPDAVLQKPGRLSPEEYGLIKLHPQIGRKILEKVSRFKPLLTVVELHHENHDGSGYPFGLSATEIPIDARIVHVADAFDAMTTTRSYRPALSLEAAIQEIERNIGRQFDPAAARAFLRLIAAGEIEIGGLSATSSQPRVSERRAYSIL